MGSPGAHTDHHRRSWRQFFRVMGPGIVSGAADNDPAGVVTYLQIGATTGTGLLWLMVLSTAMLYYLEEMSTRLGICSKRGIARIVRTRYGAPAAAALVAPVILSNLITIGADVSGTSAALGLLTGTAWEWWVLPLAAGLCGTLVFASYRMISRFLLVLTPLFVLYIVTGFVVRPPWGAVLRATFVPQLRLTAGYLSAALGLLGATLTPYMFFWQTTEEVEGRRKVEDLPDENLDCAVGMLYANVVFYFIILVSAVVFSGKGIVIQSVGDAAKSLAPIAGAGAGLLFGVGIVVSGVVAVPVMAASTAYGLAELLGWPEGLDKRIRQARNFYLLLAASLAVGAAVALLRISPVALMYWSQVLNGFVLAPLFVLLLLLANDRNIVRAHTNRAVSNLVGWGTVLLTTALAVLTAVQLLHR